MWFNNDNDDDDYTKGKILSHQRHVVVHLVRSHKDVVVVVILGADGNGGGIVGEVRVGDECGRKVDDDGTGCIVCLTFHVLVCVHDVAEVEISAIDLQKSV